MQRLPYLCSGLVSGAAQSAQADKGGGVLVASVLLFAPRRRLYLSKHHYISRPYFDWDDITLFVVCSLSLSFETGNQPKEGANHLLGSKWERERECFWLQGKVILWPDLDFSFASRGQTSESLLIKVSHQVNATIALKRKERVSKEREDR